MPEVAGIHHVKLPVTDMPRSVRWYREVFDFRPEYEFRDADGSVGGVAGSVPGLDPTELCLRVNEVAARGCKGFDPVSFAARDRADLEGWAARLDELGIAHSPIIEASIGWLLVFNDPDGLELHLYTWAAHGIDQSGRAGYGTPIADPDSWQP